MEAHKISTLTVVRKAIQQSIPEFETRMFEYRLLVALPKGTIEVFNLGNRYNGHVELGTYGRYEGIGPEGCMHSEVTTYRLFELGGNSIGFVELERWYSEGEEMMSPDVHVFALRQQEIYQCAKPGSNEARLFQDFLESWEEVEVIV